MIFVFVLWSPEDQILRRTRKRRPKKQAESLICLYIFENKIAVFGYLVMIMIIMIIIMIIMIIMIIII